MNRKTFLTLLLSVFPFGIFSSEPKELMIKVWGGETIQDFDGKNYFERVRYIFDQKKQNLGIVVIWWEKPSWKLIDRAAFVRNSETGKLDKRYKLSHIEDHGDVFYDHCDLHLQNCPGSWRELLIGKELL